MSISTVALAIVLLCGPQAASSAQASTQVIVWDADFNVVSLIPERAVLKEIDEAWKGRTRTRPAAPPRWKYKLDFYGPKEASRWLYDPAGYAMRLTKAKSPIYAVPSPGTFNRLLGIPGDADRI